MSQELRVASPPSKPLLVYDGDCQFCCRWVARWRRTTGDAIDYLPFQDPGISARFPEIPREDFEKAVRLILPDGSVCGGAEAVFRSLFEAGQERWLLRMYRRFPAYGDLAELVYEEVASHRMFLSRLDKIYGGPGLLPLSYTRVRFVFLRGLALIYLAAFVSLWGQIQGLSGSHGIVPAAAVMSSVKKEFAQVHMGWRRYLVMPTLAWWKVSDGALNAYCAAGTGLSLLLLFGLAPAPVLFLLWLIYLSLSTVCTPFLNYQWDQLLLETGFLAIFFAPLQWIERPRRQAPPSFAVLWLLRWLIFRLMLESGSVKLLSADPSWWRLTALRVHFETQPLPTWIGWHAHQLPAGALAACTFLMFVIELAGPCLIFAGRRARQTAAGAFVLLQVCILLTGNYTFFNWLTLLLCVPLLDDTVLPWPRGQTPLAPAASPRGGRWPRRIVLPVAVIVGLVTFMRLMATMGVPERWSKSLIVLDQWVHPLRSFNSYGLFPIMTQKRPEIIVEGSNDGKTWVPYQFKYKPGDLKSRPRFVAPFQPRLDWQMWFAALGRPEERLWFSNFIMRLLQGSPEVTGLLATDPFAKAPPKYIRGQLYQYHFTDLKTRRATGQWWSREYLGEFFPALTLPPGEKN